MILTSSEMQSVQTLAIYVTEKCDGCGKVLNQTFSYTIADHPEVYCSANCRDKVFDEMQSTKRRARKGE